MIDGGESKLPVMWEQKPSPCKYLHSKPFTDQKHQWKGNWRISLNAEFKKTVAPLFDVWVGRFTLYVRLCRYRNHIPHCIVGHYCSEGIFSNSPPYSKRKSWLELVILTVVTCSQCCQCSQWSLLCPSVLSSVTPRLGLQHAHCTSY